MDKYGLTLSTSLASIVGRHAAKPFERFVTRECAHLCGADALAFLGGLLRYDPAERLTAQEAMAAAYFAPVRAAHASGELPPPGAETAETGANAPGAATPQ